jgi:hypothetical protein
MVKRVPQVISPPKEVRILGKAYEVQVVPGFEDCGECFDMKQQIKLQAEMPTTLEQDTLLHEVIHALDFNMKLNMKERQVSALAAGLIGVFRDNPSFVKYLFQQPAATYAKNK